MEKWFSAYKSSNISEVETDRSKVSYYWGPIGSPIRVFYLCQNQRPSMILKVLHSVSKHR